MKPEIILEVSFKTPEEGGRKNPVVGPQYGCPILIDGEYFDCRMLLDTTQLILGKIYRLPVQFLSPHLVLPKLSIGKVVGLWEGKIIGSGKVIQFLIPK
jgi:hypothetical protein